MNLGGVGFAILTVGLFLIILFVVLVTLTTFNFWYLVLLLLGVAFTIYGFAFGAVGTALSDPNVTKAVGALLV